MFECCVDYVLVCLCLWYCEVLYDLVVCIDVDLVD